MPIKDDKSRRAYFREYMRRRRRDPRIATPERSAPLPPQVDELARKIREAQARVERSNEEWAAAAHELFEHLPLFEALVKEHDKLIDDYNELVDDYNKLLDELPDADENLSAQEGE